MYKGEEAAVQKGISEKPIIRKRNPVLVVSIRKTPVIMAALPLRLGTVKEIDNIWCWQECGGMSSPKARA